MTSPPIPRVCLRKLLAIRNCENAHASKSAARIPPKKCFLTTLLTVLVEQQSWRVAEELGCDLDTYLPVLRSLRPDDAVVIDETGNEGW